MPYLIGMGLAILYTTIWPHKRKTGGAELFDDPMYEENFVDYDEDGYIDSQDGWLGGQIDGVWYDRYNVTENIFYSNDDPFGQQNNLYSFTDEIPFIDPLNTLPEGTTKNTFKWLVNLMMLVMVANIIGSIISFTRIFRR